MGSEHERLEVLIGRWKTEGRTRESPGTPPTEIDAVDTNEWRRWSVYRRPVRVGDRALLRTKAVAGRTSRVSEMTG
jgi:hypothetical protein